MVIIRAIRQGNSLMLTIPALIRNELHFNRTDYFVVRAKSKDSLLYTKLTPRALKRLKNQTIPRS